MVKVPAKADGTEDGAGLRLRAGITGAESPVVLERVRALVDPALRSAVSGLHPDTALIIGYHCGWNDAQGNATDSVGGKGVCPALAMLASEVRGAPAQPSLSAPVAFELVHTFCHLHDDIMDHDERRRGRASAWMVFGPGPAILAGDAALNEALHVVAEDPGPHAFAATRRLLDLGVRLGFGQAQDLRFEQLALSGSGSVDLWGYLDMAGGKTGVVYSGALTVGAQLAGAGEDVLAALASAGYALGLVAQIVDDINGIWGDPQVTGKPADSDLRRRKKTLPIVAAVTADCPAGTRLTELLSRPPDDPADDPELMAELVAEAGGLDFAAGEADRQLHRALDDLAGVAMPTATRDELLGLAEFIRHRHA